MSDRVHDLYREHLGDEALERQRQAAKELLVVLRRASNGAAQRGLREVRAGRGA